MKVLVKVPVGVLEEVLKEGFVKGVKEVPKEVLVGALVWALVMVRWLEISLATLRSPWFRIPMISAQKFGHKYANIILQLLI